MFDGLLSAAEEIDACIASVSMHLSFSEGGLQGLAAEGLEHEQTESDVFGPEAHREKARQTAERQVVGLRR